MADINETEIGLGREVKRGQQLTEDSWLGQKATEARAAGVGWDDFKLALNERWEKARSAGVSDQDVMTAMGFKQPFALDGRIRDHVGSALNMKEAPVEVEGLIGSFQAGARASVTGMLTNMVVRGSGLPNSVIGADAPFKDRMAFQAGQLLGDWPTMFVGARGGTAGAFALPVAIKQAITDGYSNGAFMSSEDAAQRIAHVSWETMKAGVEGKAFDMTGGLAAQYLNKFGSTFGKSVTSMMAGLVGSETTRAILEAHIPSLQELTDSAVMMLAAHGVSKLHDAVPRVKQNLMDRWTATDVKPADSVTEAHTDPSLYTDLVAQPEGRPAPGSSATPNPGDEGEHFVVSREKGTFDTIMKDVTSINEPGIRYGISAKHNPGVNLEGLDPHTAAGILHDKYWKPLGLDDVHPEVASEVMHVAAREGIDKAQEVLDLATNVRPLLEAPKPKEGEKAEEPPTVKQAITQLIGEDKAKQLPATIAMLEKAYSGGGGGKPPGEPPKQIPNGATPRPDKGEGAYEWANPWEKAREALDLNAQQKPMTENWFQEIYRSLWNKNSPVQRLWKAVKGGDPLPTDQNALIHLRNEESSGSRSRWVIENGLKPIFERIAPEHMDDFVTYLTAFRANAEHENGVKNPMDRVAARQVLDGAQRLYGDKFATAMQDLVDYRGKLMGYMKDKGMLSQKDLDTYTQEKKYGIPGFRVRDLVQPRAPGSQVFNPVRRVKGSDDKYINPLEAMVRDTVTRIALADRNATSLALMNKAVPAGLAKVKNAPKPKTYGPDEITDMQNNGTAFDTMNPGPYNPGEVSNMVSMTHFGENTEQATARWFGGQIKDNEVPVWDNGVRKLVTFEDPEVATILRQYDEKPMGAIMKTIRGITNPLRALIIKNPAFAPVITTMDQVFQSLKPGGLLGKDSAPANYFVGLFHSFLPTGMWDQAVRNGAITHAFDKMSKDELVKDILSSSEDKGLWSRVYNKVNSPLEWWVSHWLQAPAVGSYARSMGRGESILEAQARATEAVFHRAGFGGIAGRNINGAVPFFLAHLNGLEKTAKMAFGGTSETGVKYNPATFWAKGMALVTIPAVLNWAANHDKDWYKAMPEFEKDNYLHFRIGGDGPEGYTYKFRLPPIISTMFSGIPRRMLASMIDHDPHAWEKIGPSIMEAFAPPGSSTFAPSMMTPILETMTNHSFVSGRPLVSDSEEKLLPLSRYRSYTSETAKAISQFLGNTKLTRGLNLSPVEIDHLIQGYSGNMGMSALKTVEGLVGKGDSDMKWSDLPIFNSIRARYPSASAEPIQMFRERMTTYEQVHETLKKAMRENDMPAFKAVLSNYPEMAVMHKWGLSKDTKAMLPTNAMDYFHELEQASAKISPEKQQTAIKALQDLEALKNIGKMSSAIHANANHKLQPHERSQMLDQSMIMMQQLSEQGNKYLDKTGFR